MQVVLTGSNGNRLLRLRDNFSYRWIGGSLFSILTIAIFVGSPDAIITEAA